MQHKYLILNSCINHSLIGKTETTQYLKHREFNAEKCCTGYGKSLRGQREWGSNQEF